VGLQSILSRPAYLDRESDSARCSKLVCELEQRSAGLGMDLVRERVRLFIWNTWRAYNFGLSVYVFDVVP
jgi:hypothetical protein